ncbi:L-asparaginase, type II [Raoultella ornithinolytica]|nr:L-asparaginase, type II [Raoultella ornithinolytica]
MKFSALLAMALLTISTFALSETHLPHIVILAYWRYHRRLGGE